MSTWEERMSVRTTVRRVEQRGREAIEQTRRTPLEARQAADDYQRRMWRLYGDGKPMPVCPFDRDPPWRFDPLVLACTLGWAIWALSDDDYWPACACAGPPNCCVNQFKTAELLQHDAHIVAKLLADLRNQKAG